MKFFPAALIALCLAAPAWADTATLEDLIWTGKTDQVVQAMRQDPTLVNAKQGGFTPLHLVSMNGNQALAQFLLENGAEVNALDFEGYSPLVRAKANGNEAIAKLLIEHGGKELEP